MSAIESKRFQRTTIALAVASVAAPVATQATVGRVDFAYGDVVGVSDGGEQRRLRRGAEINEGDTIITNRGRAQLRFSDGARTSLLPNSEFRVDRYEYEEEQEEESTGFFSLLKGGLRTITGVIGRLRKEAYRVTTPSATIGIRGTEYLVVLGNSASVWVADGEIEACNDGGCTNFEGGESGYIADQNTKPMRTDQKPDTSGGDVETEEYSAAEDVNDEGTPDVVTVQQTSTPPTVTPGPFDDGALYAVAVSIGDSSLGADTRLVANQTTRTNGTFLDRRELNAYRLFFTRAEIVAAEVVETGDDGSVLGWGRWTNGTIFTTLLGGAGNVELTGSESHHYVVGLPTLDMPTSGTATYVLAGGTSPTYTDGTGVGTLDSAGLNVDFGSRFMSINVGFTIGGNSFAMSTTTDVGQVEGVDFGFEDFGNFTSSSACSAGCSSEVQGFFAGSGASAAACRGDRGCSP